VITATSALLFAVLYSQGEDGIVWNKRIFGDTGNAFNKKYGWSQDASAAAPAKVVSQVDSKPCEFFSCRNTIQNRLMHSK
jgi:hypothetical protein